MKPFEGQTALVTGASSGIGAAIAVALGAAGANVGVNYSHSEEGVEQVIDEITRAGGRAVALRADVRREGEVLAMFDALFDSYGTIDILVSNAGIQKDAAFVDMTLEQWAASLLKLIPYGRIGEPDDGAPVAVWPASDEADYLTGTTIFVDGGMRRYPAFRTGG